MLDYAQLPIQGFGGERLPHLFLKQQKSTDHATIVFPGLGYSAQMPVLYYPARVLLDAGSDVLRVDTSYINTPGFRDQGKAGRQAWIKADVEAAVHALLSHRAYARLTVIGKSLGTRAMGHVLTAMALPEKVDAIWLTPLLTDQDIRVQIAAYGGRSLFVIGTADQFYSANFLAEAERATEGSSVVIPGADHSLEFGGDVQAALDAMQAVVRAVQEFIGG